MSLLRLENGALCVEVNPQIGGTVTAVRHRATGLSVLGSVPWETIDTPLASLAARDEPEWLTRYAGGWPLLFPNAGDACTVDGVFHGFHGEASISPWRVIAASADQVLMERQFRSLPATMRRSFLLRGETLTVHEELAYAGTSPADVMWGHHPTFGSDLLAAPFEITCGGCDVRSEGQYDPPACPILPGARGRWPMIGGKKGVADLSRPRAPWASVIYLENFQDPWVAVRREDDAVAALLAWDRRRFPCAWLWYELVATAEPPWSGRARLIGVEPNTTPCALGLRNAKRRGAALLRLTPGETYDSWVSLHVFRPEGSVLHHPA